MIRAEDLMIGDWVKTVCPKQESYERVSDIHSSGYPYIITAGSEEKWFLVEVEPIPLTPEILEKNGWSLWEIEGEYKHQKSSVITLYGRKLPFSVFDGIEINYVHELQHALKLCGINLEIKL